MKSKDSIEMKPCIKNPFLQPALLAVAALKLTGRATVLTFPKLKSVGRDPMIVSGLSCGPTHLLLGARRRWPYASLLMILFLCTIAEAAVRVSPSGGGPLADGSTWDKAYGAGDLQRVIDSVGGEIWLAIGGYPSVHLRKDLQLYGGFRGLPTELSRDQRDPVNNFTAIGDGCGCSIMAFPYDDFSPGTYEQIGP